MEFSNWYKSARSSEVIEFIGKLLRDRWSGLSENPLLHVHKSPYANGFYFHFGNYVSVREFSFLFDWMRNQSLELGYNLYTSDTIYSEKETFVEKREKHYLKPSGSASVPPIDQRFGNILIEQVWIDDQPNYIKMMAMVYSDRNYTVALPPSELFAALFPNFS